jgi:histone-lysine N-methyltransferase SETMAR
MLIQHDNARTQTSLRTQEAIATFGWTVLQHPTYSPDLAPSDFHLFLATEGCTAWENRLKMITA